MTCQHRFDDTGLQCTRDEHEDRGHIYESTSAGDDRHTEGGHG